MGLQHHRESCSPVGLSSRVPTRGVQEGEGLCSEVVRDAEQTAAREGLTLSSQKQLPAGPDSSWLLWKRSPEGWETKQELGIFRGKCGWPAGLLQEGQGEQDGLQAPLQVGEGRVPSQLCPQHLVLILGGQFLVSAVPPKLQGLWQSPAPGGAECPGADPWTCLSPLWCHPCQPLLSLYSGDPVSLLVCASGAGGPGETVSPLAAMDRMSQAGPSAGQGQGPRLSDLQ